MRLRRAATETILRWGLLLGAASVGVGYLIVATVRIDTLPIWDYGSLSSLKQPGPSCSCICLALFASFIAVGVMIATLFARQSERIGRAVLRRPGRGRDRVRGRRIADRLDRAAGHDLSCRPGPRSRRRCVIAVRCAFADACFPALSYWWWCMAIVVVRPGVLPEQRADAFKGQLDYSATRVLGMEPDLPRRRRRHRARPAGSCTTTGWSARSSTGGTGSSASLGQRLRHRPRSLPFAVAASAPKQRDDHRRRRRARDPRRRCTIDAHHIDAVELNPVTYSLVTDKFADYSGHLAENPDVNYVKGDGRSYLARSDNTYNLVWYPAPDSYSATNAASAGAYVLSESYLYTSETIQDSLEHLGAERDPRRPVRRVRLRRASRTARPGTWRRRAQALGELGHPRSFPPHARRHVARRERELLALDDPREARRRSRARRSTDSSPRSQRCRAQRCGTRPAIP